ncbi:DUF4238 domain-containing protein [Yersinia ruckeri]|uniref:DUF4238 domain-containing protein n=1 Tax=Yersinia ruckeri TaxID=29486 RepID=UPI002237B9E6|nr:DUF4238 domain-containing protein [Yersinia ruckeri]MCW6556093.1 DUF4238 domain-containing protein [Yersinia ruckeri]UZX74420.1 DUF4238 domain-containing protein [Yersinia ruckeri]
MAEKANQHFVPRLLLKRFSNSEGKINIFDTSSGEIISDVPYKPQCAKKYFYGSDLIIENQLANLEDIVGKVISGVIDQNTALEINSEAHVKLVVFSAYQYIRTPEAISLANNVIRKNINVMILKDKEVLISQMKDVVEKRFEQVVDESFYEDFLSSLEVSLLNPHKILFETANNFVFELLNFEMFFLRNETNQEFFISDHPLVFIGPDDNDKRTLLLPLSPMYTLIFFERGKYNNFVEKSGVISVCSLTDVDSLNRIQYLNCNRNIYFSSGINDDYLIEMHENNKVDKLKDKLSYVADEMKIFIRRRNTDFKLDLDCLKNKLENVTQKNSIELSFNDISLLKEKGYLEK